MLVLADLRCSLPSAPDDFTRLTHLELLHLDGQNFDSIPADITEQGGKTILDYIRKMALADTTATLDLSGMRIKKLPSAVLGIIGLQHLFLHDNPISRLPPMIIQLTNLKTVCSCSLVAFQIHGWAAYSCA